MKIISAVFVLMTVVVSVSFAEQNAILSEPTTSVPDRSGADAGSQKQDKLFYGKQDPDEQ